MDLSFEWDICMCLCLSSKVMISVNNIFGIGYCFFLLIYNERLDNILEALL